MNRKAMQELDENRQERRYRQSKSYSRRQVTRTYKMAGINFFEIIVGRHWSHNPLRVPHLLVLRKCYTGLNH